jgi:hypothetical protein
VGQRLYQKLGKRGSKLEAFERLDGTTQDQKLMRRFQLWLMLNLVFV